MKNSNPLRLIRIGVAVFLGSMVFHQMTRIEALNQKTRALESKLERYENYYVFHNAEEVSKITEVPLYQVLTGLQVPGESNE